MTDLETQLRELIVTVVREELARQRPAAPVEYLTVRQAAELARITTGTIHRWLKTGKLPRHNAGRAVRVKRSDLERLLATGGRVEEIDPVAWARERFG